jgi:S-adenosylmethionine:tRNA ribosyltransferase-isomerase
MDVREFDFDLPVHLIAQEPASERTAARLLCVDRHSGVATDSLVSALPELLRAGDLLVVNNTRVFPARLLGRRVTSGGGVECLLVRRLLPDTRVGETPGAEVWEALVHPGQKLKPGARAVFEGVRTLHAEILERGFFGRRVIRLCADDGRSVEEAIDALGHVPLPPYIKRQDAASDRDRYQTVFAWRRGSIAAPTAGLHFTPALLDALSARGVERTEITLHVGYGTFQPVRVERVEDHRLEAEQYEIGQDAAEAITRACRERRRVIAVGTTTTRTLESVAREHDGAIVPCSGSSDLFISPGFRFRVISGLLTNFHLPRSSLLMLVSAFAGRDRVLAAYRAAVASGYRFYSYGDAMLIT